MYLLSFAYSSAFPYTADKEKRKVLSKGRQLEKCLVCVAAKPWNYDHNLCSVHIVSIF